MTDGKNKEVLRAKFKELNPEKEPLTKAGKISKDYESFLMENCKPHWASTVAKFNKKIQDIDAGKIKASDALEEVKKEARLEEKCALGIGGKLASNKKEWEIKYKIKF
jgi:hypothetical protein